MIETEIDNMTKEIEQRLMYQGMKLEQYLQMLGKTMEDFRKEYEEQATTSVKNRLVLEAIIKEEKIKPDNEKVEAKVKEMAELYGKKEEELKQNEGFMKYIEESMKNEKVVEFLVENAKIKWLC